MRLALTDKAILALEFSDSGQRIVRDAELPGFFLMVGKRTKTFMVQGDLRQNGKRHSLRLKVGEAGDVRTREARARIAAKIAAGQVCFQRSARTTQLAPLRREAFTKCDLRGRFVASTLMAVSIALGVSLGGRQRPMLS